MEDDIAHHISSFFHPAAPHFFKIVLQETIRTGKLVVPKKFVRKYGKDLSVSSVVLLKVPSGDAWEVELRKGDTDVWLQKGWLDFANFYSIKHGHFLVFKYEAGSSNVFNVFVFDKSATEIEYPVRSKVTLSSIKVENIDEDSDNIPVKKRNTRPISGIMTRSRTRLTGHSRMPENGRRGPLRGKEKLKALERAKSFKSSNPYFPVVMQPYYVHRSYSVYVPGNFLQRYMGQQKNGQMKLHVSGGKTWTVTYRISAYRSQIRGKIYNGWKAFVVDNSIVLGDICVFELIRGLRNVSFKISIFRAPQVATNSCILQSQGEKKLNCFFFFLRVVFVIFSMSMSLLSIILKDKVISFSFRVPVQKKLIASGGGATRSKLEWCSGAAAEDRGNNSSLDVTKAKERQKIVQDFEFQPVNGFVPGQHPVFQMVMTKGCLSKGYLKIATTFMKENIDLKHKKQRVTLKADHEDRSWTITLITGLNPRPWAMFSGGFMAFLKENSLKAGDVCTFELIGRAEMVFRVSISRVKQ
ncbi:B3 domain-containing transcription factor VRN1-like [Punica granatum]|uniref:B3 domain-containing transcription factor VRN1-like n=1 Tax=Punica granatum TaxID=22663 RepID=A0A6P8CYA1_PUNGR|nr:B3 domain-containing transcription factor VRN1-like [Punica granatum]